MKHVWYHVKILLSCPDSLRKITLKRELIFSAMWIIDTLKNESCKKEYFRKFDQFNTSILTGLLAWTVYEALNI